MDPTSKGSADSGLPPAVDLDFERWRRREKLGWEQRRKVQVLLVSVLDHLNERCICFDFTGLTVIILTGAGLFINSISRGKGARGSCFDVSFVGLEVET